MNNRLVDFLKIRNQGTESVKRDLILTEVK